ncbi:unnamed protein product [Arctogadus glacialis]
MLCCMQQPSLLQQQQIPIVDHDLSPRIASAKNVAFNWSRLTSALYVVDAPATAKAITQLRLPRAGAGPSASSERRVLTG